MSITMSYDYIRKPKPFARAKTSSKKLESLLMKRQRWGSNSNLEREIKNVGSLLDDYLIEGVYEAMESIHVLQDSLDEYESLKSAGYMTSEQIDQGDAIKSHLGALLANR